MHVIQKIINWSDKKMVLAPSVKQTPKVWSGIGVKIKVAFHCTDLAFYAVLFEFNVASVAFSCSVAN